MVRIQSKHGYLYTRVNEIDTELSGGIVSGSLVFMEGNAKTGKSIVCQYLAHNAMRYDGRSVAYYNTRFAVREVIDKMEALKLPVTDEFLADRLRIFPMDVPKGAESVQEYCRILTDHISALPERFGLVIIDGITAIMNALDPVTTMDFLYVCKQLCNEAKSIVLVCDSHAIKKGIISKVTLVVDSFLRFRSEYRRLNPDMVDNRLIRIMNVEKLNSIEQQPRTGVKFDIDPDTGLEILPITEMAAN